MKTNILTAITLATILFACTRPNPNLVTISGKITNPIGEYVGFNGKDTSYSTSTKEEGTFEITFSLDSSEYLSFNHGVEQSAMYVKPGDHINLTVDTKRFDETINYQGSPASSFLAKKYLMREQTDFYGEAYYLGSPNEYKVYMDKSNLPLLDELQKVKDSSFIKNEMSKMEKDIAYFVGRKEQFEEWAKNYEKDVRVYLMQRNELSNKYDFRTAVDSLNSVEFDNMLNEYANTLNALLSKVSNKEYTIEEKENQEKNRRWWREQKGNTDNMPKEGEAAVDFTYPDTDGNEYSLSSFKGYLVYVDVWSTSCGPCIEEFPALQKLEKEYHGKNMIFLSISIDRDKDDWLKMVNEKELGDVQLWAGDLWGDGEYSGIVKHYAIYSIPRFMLFSADGTVISIDAPRPSSTGLRSLLDANL